MSAFYLALAAVDRTLIALEARKENGEGPTAPLTEGIDLDRLQRHRHEAAPLLRRVAPSIDAGIDSLMRDAAEKAKLRVKGKLDTATRGSALAGYMVRVEFLEFFLPRLKSHQNVLRDVFGDSSSSAIRIVQAAETSESVPRLFKLASVRMASGGKFSTLKKWTQEATAICGNPVSEIEEVSVDVATTDALLDQVARNNRKLDGLDPTDPSAAEVTQDNSQLLEQVSRVAEESKDPQSVKTHAASRLAKGDTENKGNYTTTISAHLKMTPEQEESLLVRGKAIIAAGAGSGKTRVLAGKVIHHLQDLGLSMSNVMAVSFTIKSSGELKERILKYGKEIGYNLPDPSSNWEAYAGIGTTHSIGRGILKKSNGGWKANPKDVIKGSEITNLLKVAIAQVKMRAAGGGEVAPPPDAMTFFPNLPSASPKIPSPSKPKTKLPAPAPTTAPDEEMVPDPALESTSPIQNPVEQPSPLDFYLSDEGRFRTIVTAAVDTIQDFLSAIPKVKTYPLSNSGWARAEIFGPGLVRFGDDVANMSVGGSRKPSFKPSDNYGPDRFVFFSKREFDRNQVIQELNDALGVPQANNALNALKKWLTVNPADLSPNEREIFEGIVTNPLVASGLTARNVLTKTAETKTATLLTRETIREMAKGPKKAADEPGEESPQDDVDPSIQVSEKGIESASARKLRNLDYDKSPYYFYLHNPANQWFNLGATDDDFKMEDAKGNKRDIPIGEFARFTGFNKNSLKAPGALFSESEAASTFAKNEFGEDEPETEGDDLPGSKRIFSAVYGAYEWLKRNMPLTKGRLDHDDQLIQSSRELIENPSLLAQYQKKYKCVLVDEAQDLNAAQHMMFGLIAGYIDPSTLAPRTDGKTSADTFAYIGDDKQAIYEFRAADPTKFIEKSDLVPGGEGFTTKLLDTNFRSGSVIVEAANKLIAYNTKQIPMVCKTDPARGEGAITRIETKNYEDASDTMANQILAEFEEAKADGQADKFYSRYGLAVRTNKEVYDFAMKMIEKGIPFRSKKNFLGGPAVGPVVGIFQILRKDNVQARNEGVIAGLSAPDFGLNRNTVRSKLDELGVTDYYKFLVDDRGARSVYTYKKMSDRLEEYAQYIEEVVRVGESGSASDVIDLILNTKGPDGDTFVDSLAASVMDDAEAMEDLRTEAAKDETAAGHVSAERVAEYALAPINPLRKAAERFPTATEFVNFIKGLLEANEKNPKEGEELKDAVQIDTVHGWKGLEVANLYVPMAQGIFPHKMAMKTEKGLESERRLAYVALTRGRNRVTLLEPKSDLLGKPTAASQFAFEACIPLTGPSKTEPAPDQPVDTKTASVNAFLIPTRSEPPSFEVSKEASSDPLETAWGPTLRGEN